MASLKIQKQEVICKSTTSFNGRKENKTASRLADDILLKLIGTEFTKHNQSFLSCMIYSPLCVNHMTDADEKEYCEFHPKLSTHTFPT